MKIWILLLCSAVFAMDSDLKRIAEKKRRIAAARKKVWDKRAIAKTTVGLFLCGWGCQQPCYMYSNSQAVQQPVIQNENANSGCKYVIPNESAEITMNYIMCAKEPYFEKYLVDNSEKCSRVKELYEKVKKSGKCALNIPKSIINGAFAKFLGEELSHETNMKMLKEYLETIPDIAESYDSLHRRNLNHLIYEVQQMKRHHNNPIEFDFFRFDNMFQVTKTIDFSKANEVFVTPGRFGDDASNGVQAAAEVLEVFDKHRDVELVKKKFEFFKFVYPNEVQRFVEAYRDPEWKKYNYNLDHAKQVLEFTKNIYPEDLNMARLKAVSSDYKDLNIDHAKGVLELIKLTELSTSFFDSDKMYSEALTKYKDANLAMIKLTKIIYPAYYQKVKQKEDGINSGTINSWPEYHMAAKEALKSKYKEVDAGKVYDKFQELRKRLWIPYYTAERDTMIEALTETYPKLATKENFNQNTRSILYEIL